MRCRRHTISHLLELMDVFSRQKYRLFAIWIGVIAQLPMQHFGLQACLRVTHITLCLVCLWDCGLFRLIVV